MLLEERDDGRVAFLLRDRRAVLVLDDRSVPSSPNGRPPRRCPDFVLSCSFEISRATPLSATAVSIGAFAVQHVRTARTVPVDRPPSPGRPPRLSPAAAAPRRRGLRRAINSGVAYSSAAPDLRADLTKAATSAPSVQIPSARRDARSTSDAVVTKARRCTAASSRLPSPDRPRRRSPAAAAPRRCVALLAGDVQRRRALFIAHRPPRRCPAAAAPRRRAPPGRPRAAAYSRPCLARSTSAPCPAAAAPRRRGRSCRR